MPLKRLIAALICLGAAVGASFLILAVTNEPTPPGDLRTGGGNGTAGEAQGGLHSGVAYTVGSQVPLCTKSGKPITVTSVRLDGASNVRLIDWGVWKTYGYRDLLPGSAYHSAYAVHPPHVVSSRCAPRGALQQVVVSVRLLGKRGEITSFHIRSTSGSVDVRFTVALCTTAKCKFVRS